LASPLPAYDYAPCVPSLEQFDDDTSTVLEEDVEFINQWAERLAPHDIVYEPNPGGSVWPDDDNVSISFDAGCDDTTNETASTSTTDYDGREKSVPGGRQRPNDSGQFEIHTAKNIHTKMSKVINE
ncbi:hypothetical protein THAOC_12361, partial [Thalassiosira oceanica]